MAGFYCPILYLHNQVNPIERLEATAIQMECLSRIAGEVRGICKHFKNIMKKVLILIVGVIFLCSCNSVNFDSSLGDELYSKMESLLNSIFMEKTVLPLLVAVICIGLFILYLYFYIKSKQSLQWYNVKGTVLKSELDESCMGSGEPVTYKAKIEYSYTVAEKTYYSERIFYGDFLRHNLPFRSGKFVEKYKEGDVVNVFYNPHNPKEAVLQQGVHSNVVRILITLFLLIGFTYLFYNVFK